MFFVLVIALVDAQNCTSRQQCSNCGALAAGSTCSVRSGGIGNDGICRTDDELDYALCLSSAMCVSASLSGGSRLCYLQENSDVQCDDCTTPFSLPVTMCTGLQPCVACENVPPSYNCYPATGIGTQIGAGGDCITELFNVSMATSTCLPTSPETTCFINALSPITGQAQGFACNYNTGCSLW
jgi:hypothetical protein